MDDNKNLLDAAGSSEYFWDSGLESPLHHASDDQTRTDAALPIQQPRTEKSKPFPEAQLGTQSIEASTKRKTREFTDPTYVPILK